MMVQENAAARWKTARPSIKDETLVLCIPAAFTDTFLGMNSVHGAYAEAGKLGDQNKRDRNIGGLVTVIKGACEVKAAPGGEIDKATRQSIVDQKGDLFQQFQVIANGKAEKFRDSSRFQRRGIAILKDKKTAVIESAEQITLSQFATDLVELGAQQLAYTDMGPWDEGFYRDPKSNKVVTIGHDRAFTNRQTNWLTFYTLPKTKTAH